MNIQIFDPVKSALAVSIEEAKLVTCTDLRDKAQVEAVKKKRKEVRGIEIDIERIGKEAREEARKYAQNIIDMEKDLKKMTAPEIERFDKILEEAEQIKIRDERLLDLPHRKERLVAVGASILIDDEYILSLDALQFDNYYNQVVAIKQKADMEEAQAKINAENEKLRIERENLEAEKREIEKQKQIKEAEERARVAEQQRLANLQAEKEANEKRQAEEAQRQKALLPDKEKLLEFATMLDDLTLPDVQDATMKAVTLQVKCLLFKVSNYIRQNTV